MWRAPSGDPEAHVIAIVDKDTGVTFNPSVGSDGQVSADHGMIIKASNPFGLESSKVYVIGGSFGQGTLAAALFFSSEDLISGPKFFSYVDFELLLKSEIIDQWPQSPKLIQCDELRYFQKPCFRISTSKTVGLDPIRNV